jgi:hypothetical protein
MGCAGRLIWLYLGILLTACGGPTQLVVVSDDCLDDDFKIEPEECGCGVPEQRCIPLKQALVHRYAFEGTGVVALDHVGGAHGTIVNGELTGNGELHLGRELEEYVDLPNGIISVLSSATFEAWLVWDAPEADQFWERIFDFGVSTAGEEQRESGESYIFLAPAQFRTAYKNLVTPGEVLIDARDPFPIGALAHVAVVVDEQAHELRLYLNAVEQGRVALDQPLATVQDVNNWLGRSQFAVDTRFGGTFLEFRIYAAALTQAELEGSLGLGPSPEFLSLPEPPGAQDASGPVP